MNTKENRHTAYAANPIDTELIRLFELRQQLSKTADANVDEQDRLDEAIEMARLLRDHCVENRIRLTQLAARFRIERATDELLNDNADPSVCYDNAMNILLYGLEFGSRTKAS